MLSPRQRLAIAVAAFPVIIVAGCTSKTGGSPSPDTSTAGGSTTSVKPSKSARPRSIDLHNVDPCQILTTQQRQQFGLDGNPVGGTAPAFDDAKSCSIRDNEHDLSTRLALVTTKGIEVWTNGTFTDHVEPIQVAGLPGLLVKPDGQTSFCNVEIDVADGQFLEARWTDNSGKLPLDQLCQTAQQVAEAATTSLKAGG